MYLMQEKIVKIGFLLINYDCTENLDIESTNAHR